MMAPQEEKNAAIARQYEVFKQRRLELQAEEKRLAEERAAAKAKTEAYYLEHRAKPRVARVPHSCSGCGREIAAGQKYTPHVRICAGSSKLGGNGHFETDYYCQNCRPVEEV